MMMMMIVFSKAMLCHYAFPDCVIRAGDAAGLPLCYEECVAIQQQFCYTEWADLLKQREQGAVFRSRGHFRLPECKLLPKIEQGMGGWAPSSIIIDIISYWFMLLDNNNNNKMDVLNKALLFLLFLLSMNINQ